MGSGGASESRIQLGPLRGLIPDQTFPKVQACQKVKTDPRIPENLRPAGITLPPNTTIQDGSRRLRERSSHPRVTRMQRPGLDPPQASPVHSPTAQATQVCNNLLSRMSEQSFLSHQRAFPEASSGSGPVLDTEIN